MERERINISEDNVSGTKAEGQRDRGKGQRHRLAETKGESGRAGERHLPGRSLAPGHIQYITNTSVTIQRQKIKVIMWRTFKEKAWDSS